MIVLIDCLSAVLELNMYTCVISMKDGLVAGEKVWWRKLPNREEPGRETPVTEHVASKQKNFLDPIKDVKRFLGCDTDKLSLKRHIKEEKNNSKRKRSPSTDSSPHRRKKRKREKDKKHKSKITKKHRHAEKKKKKKTTRRRSPSSSESSDEEAGKRKQKANLDKLRRERLERERREREKANRLLTGEPEKTKEETEAEQRARRGERQTYNSQFNPSIARQNKLDPKEKYWLQ